MDADFLVIGAGAIGLSIAYSLSKAGYSVILVDKEKNFGLGVSSRSTEVIHSGAYYAANSLKGKLCIRGKKLLYEFCNENQILHKKIPKLFIANTKDDFNNLIEIQKKANANGLLKTEILSNADVKKIEPQIICYAALLSPTSGIFDSQNYMQVLFQKCLSYNTTIAFNSPFENAEIKKNYVKTLIGGVEPVSLKTNYVINAAGLGSINISKKIFPHKLIPTANYLKGVYARYNGKIELNHIIYPSFSPGIISERVDTTPDLYGSLRFGPSIEEGSKYGDFSIPNDLVNRFFLQLKRYLIDVDEAKIQPDYAAFRPKINYKGNKNPDFVFNWNKNKTWLDLWGFESPALTASLAVGEFIKEEIRNQ